MRSVDQKISPMLKKPPLKMLERYLHTTDRMMHRWPPFLDRGSSHIVLSAYLYRRLLMIWSMSFITSLSLVINIISKDLGEFRNTNEQTYTIASELTPSASQLEQNNSERKA